MPVNSAESSQHTADIDALWNRYEAMSQAASPDPLGEAMASSTVTGSPEPPQSEAARQRQAEREAIRQRRAAVVAARDDSLAQIRQLAPDDVNGLVDVIEGFNQQLEKNGVEEQINIGGIRKQLVGSQRLADISQAMLDEALKGEDADPERLQALSSELREIQNDLVGRDNMHTSAGIETP
ncbi:hypothetical protein AAG587_07020 [Vreelandella neptunia]|uniref:hypothetical protein n=1 Tax=Vreelandella neptunia TaxID=115551 RepID=UPI003159A470